MFIRVDISARHMDEARAARRQVLPTLDAPAGTEFHYPGRIAWHGPLDGQRLVARPAATRGLVSRARSPRPHQGLAP
ncbi:MAG: hypothetical protein K2Q97_13345, partial [Burkholderiaceae bacterium]|nr:hypothetical protein [Burkholderiaceae bacterium]